MSEDLGWWTISGAMLMECMERAAGGEDPSMLYAELYANSDHQKVEPAEEEKARPVRDQSDLSLNNLPLLGPTLPVDLPAIEARLNGVTKGPWMVKGSYPQEILANDDGLTLVATVHESPECYPFLSEFISHAREDVPAMAAEIRRLRAAIEGKS